MAATNYYISYKSDCKQILINVNTINWLWFNIQSEWRSIKCFLVLKFICITKTNLFETNLKKNSNPWKPLGIRYVFKCSANVLQKCIQNFKMSNHIFYFYIYLLFFCSMNASQFPLPYYYYLSLRSPSQPSENIFAIH